MIYLALTDDHPLMAEGIRNILKNLPDIQFVASFTTAQQTLDAELLKETDVLLLDINLPDMDGISLCQHLVKRFSNLKIVGLTSYNETAYAKGLMKAGAKGYLLKNAPSEEIIQAIKAVYQGGVYIQEEIKDSLLSETLNHGKNKNSIPKLTRREKEILTLLAEEYTTREMADRLFISIKTIETHRQNLMLKFGVKNSVGLVKTAYEKGLL